MNEVIFLTINRGTLNKLNDVNLPSSPVDGDLLMYNGNTGKWEPVLSGQPYHFEVQTIANQNTTTIHLNQSYTLGNNSLMVFLNGMLQLLGPAQDYVETDPNTISFNTPINSGDVVVLRIQ
jgi:hypothetical protein